MHLLVLAVYLSKKVLENRVHGIGLGVDLNIHRVYSVMLCLLLDCLQAPFALFIL